MSFDLALINNDLNIQADGSVQTVTDTPKLRQDVIKIILTPLGSVRPHPWYGCSVSEEIIGRNLPAHILDAQIKNSVSQALERLKTLQITQSSTQKVSLAEMIQVIGDVHAERDVDDQRKVNIVVTILTKRLTKIEEVFTLIA